MKKGISVEITHDYLGNEVLMVSKKRGKLTVQEIQEAILHHTSYALYGHYVIILNCTEAVMGGNGMYLDDPEGDSVELHRLDELDNCPVCGKMLPPFEYCPNCGERWHSSE